MGIWDDNIEMVIKGTSFLRLNSSLQQGKIVIFGDGNDVILHKQ